MTYRCDIAVTGGLHRLANFEHDFDYVVNNVPEGHQNGGALQFKGNLTKYKQINFQDVRKSADLSREENEQDEKKEQKLNSCTKVETKVNSTTTDQCRCYHNCQKCSKSIWKKARTVVD